MMWLALLGSIFYIVVGIIGAGIAKFKIEMSCRKRTSFRSPDVISRMCKDDVFLYGAIIIIAWPFVLLGLIISFPVAWIGNFLTSQALKSRPRLPKLTNEEKHKGAYR